MSVLNRKKGYLILIFYLSLFLPVFGQESKWYLKFKHIGSDMGLSEPTNHFLFKDSKGYVWISSAEGLNRFDGRRLKIYKTNPDDKNSLLDDNIQSPFFEDNNGDIWFTTINCIHVYRRNQDYFERYSIEKDTNISQSTGYTALCLEQKRWLWVQVEGKLYKFDTQSSANSRSIYLHDLDAIRFSVDTFLNGQVRQIVACYWIAKEGIDILDYDKYGKLRQKQTFFVKKQTDYPAFNIQQTLIENHTTIWLATGKLLIKMNPEKPMFFKTYNPSPWGSTVTNLAFIQGKDLCVSSDQSPLLVFFQKNERFSKDNLLYSEFSKSIYKSAQLYNDESNNLWVSTKKQGIYYSALQWQHFSNPIRSFYTLPHSIEQIVEDKNGHFWLSYSNIQNNEFGYFRLEKNKALVKKESSLSFPFKFLQSKHGQFWCIKRKASLSLYDFTKNKFTSKIVNSNIEATEFKDINDSTLLISRIKNPLFYNTKTNVLSDDALNEIIFRFYKSGNYLWAESNNGNLLCYEIDINRIGKIVKKFDSYNEINHFYDSKYTPSVLWVATAKGLVKINTETLTDTLFTVKDGLPSNYLQAVLEDKQGNLWCSTNSGIVKYNPIAKKAKLYTRRQGLSSDTYNRGAALLSSTGEMWFGGTNGVDVFHPDSIKDQSQAPQSAIVGLKIYDKYWKGETAIEEAKEISLKHYENTLTFELAAMEYTDPENNRYKVMLEGAGQKAEWSDLGTQNFVTFVNLREGRYVFKLITTNSGGVTNETPKTLVIDIKPPYWRTGWFYALLTILICSLMYGVYKYRLNQVLKMERLRNRISADLHDDIGATLSNVNILTTLVRQRLPNDVDVLPLLTRIEEEISTSSESLDDIIWSVNPQNDSMERVLSRMRQFATEVFDARNIEGSIDFDNNLSHYALSMDKRRDFYLIFKEAVNNLAKYANCCAADISLSEIDGKLKLIVSDKGVGFDPLSIREGNGQKTMRQRANRLKADLKIESALGIGTTVELILPL